MKIKNQTKRVEKKSKKGNRGITLIALVVTIVVLIILAVISINAVLGENGLIRQAERASEFQTNAEASDSEVLSEYDKIIANAMAGKGETPETPSNPDDATNPLAEYKKDEMLDKKENTEVTIGDDTVWIPAGFKVHEESANVVDEGIVITDGTNEFVWVPVSDESFNQMFITANPPVYLRGGSGEDYYYYYGGTVTSNYYSNLREGNNNIGETPTNGQFPRMYNREPDLIPDFDENTTDEFYKQAGFDSSQAMAEAFVEDYANMRASIQKYKGFYIGRYELTGTVDSPTVQAGAVLTASTAGNWYGLYKACRDVKGNDAYVTSTMIWGCQWDETMNWLTNTKFNGDSTYVDSDSSSWGNYSDYNTKNGYEEGEAEYISVAGSPQNTGYSEYWSANKIYDLAGNYFDWTQEASNMSSRISRGGYFYSSASYDPASDRCISNPLGSDSSARATLYINL